MKSFTSYVGQQPKYLVEGYDWDSVGDGLVVDVGGAEGFMSIVIAEKYPSLNFNMQELLEVAKNAQKNLPNSLTGRVKFEEHIFLPSRRSPLMYIYSVKYSISILMAIA